MTEMTIYHLSDPGHGWLMLDTQTAAELGLTADDMSECSYHDPRTGTIWAEEDCDAAVVVAAHHRLRGCMPKIEARNMDREALAIRGLPRCSAGDPKWKEAVAYLAKLRAGEAA